MNTWHDYYPQLNISDFVNRVPTGLSSKIMQYVKKGSRILETGIGSGVESIYLSHLGYEVYGIDNDEVIIKRAVELNKKLDAAVSFAQTDIFQTGFKDKSFEAVFHQGLLEHYGEKEIVTIIREQLRIGEIVIFSIPTDKFDMRSPGVYPTGSFGDENLWNFNKWERIIKNFNILEVFGSGVVLPKWKRLLINLVYLPFWFFYEEKWQKRYLVYCMILGFVLKE